MSEKRKSSDPENTPEGIADLPLLVAKPEIGRTTEKPRLFWRIFAVLRFVPLVMLFAATIGVVALYFQPPGLQKLMQILNLQPGAGTSSPIAVPNNKTPTVETDAVSTQPVIGLGILVPDGDITNIAMPFGSADARIAEIHVEEGQNVEKGDLLARLDNENNILAQIANAKAAVDARQAQLEQTRQSVIASIAETTAAMRKAEAALSNAQSEYDRAKSLFDRGYTTNSVLEQRKSSRDQAAGEVARLEATLARFTGADIDLQPDVKVARSNLDSAMSELARAESDLSKALVKSPVAGTVLKIHTRSGERPAGGVLMNIANIDRMTARVEVYQTEIGKVRIGAPVILTAEALSSSLTGTVSKIGLEVGRQSIVDSSPAANTDARVVEVTVVLDEASSGIARRYTNLQVIARIERIGQ